MYFITISEMIGTKGESIARKAAEELNYTFYGEKELFDAASEMGFLSDVQKLDEKSPALLERFFSEKPKIYLDRLQSVIYEVAKKGNGVFFGRGGKFLLQSFDCAFHILVTGSMEKRIQRVMEEKQVGREIAEKIVYRSDHDKKAFIRFAYDAARLLVLQFRAVFHFVHYRADDIPNDVKLVDKLDRVWERRFLGLGPEWKGQASKASQEKNQSSREPLKTL